MTKELEKLLGQSAGEFEKEENFFLEASRKSGDTFTVPASLDDAVKAAAALAVSGKSSRRTGRPFIAWFAAAAAAFIVCMAIVYSVDTGVYDDLQVTVALSSQTKTSASDDGIMANIVDFDADMAEVEFAMANSLSDYDGENGLNWISASENDLYQLYAEI